MHVDVKRRRTLDEVRKGIEYYKIYGSEKTSYGNFKYKINIVQCEFKQSKYLVYIIFNVSSNLGISFQFNK